MGCNILTIADSLLEPPSEPMSIRTITMITHYDLHMNILLHTTQEMKDIVYHFAKPLGLMDYIDDIINEQEFEDGVRIDIIGIYPRCIVVKSIRLEDQLSILGKIKSLAGKE